ncbi:MAG: tRNA uridine-5-carboxymethylaminomethyl(34) synthesis GTPase MnmE [Clostridia bacterium]
MQHATIAAIATAAGEGAVAIIRISGPDALPILRACFVPAEKKALRARSLTYGHVLGEDGQVLDEVMAAYLPAPRTYTREDVVEIQGHGGRAVVEQVLSRVLALGAMPAQPGEFTKRAFLNGRIDLCEAEAVMALIASESESAARAALRQLDGGVTRVIDELKGQLIELLGLIEASDDFPEEIEEAAAKEDVLSRLDQLIGQMAGAVDPRGARLVTDGASVVLVGRPNTGKSSLMNALTASERAIVTSAPGTTRDLLTARLRLGGLDVTLTDTAGQRLALGEAEQIGVARAKKAQHDADVVLMVLDGSQPLTREDEALLKTMDARTILLVNKCDLPKKISLPEWTHVFFVSAATGMGLSDVQEAIEQKLGRAGAQGFLLTERRHISLAQCALAALARARETLTSGAPLDLAALDFEEALSKILEITGKNASEEVIDHIFSTFCVGK